MSRSLVQPVDALREDTIDVPHASRQVGVRRFDDEVIVVGHQAVRMTDPRETIDDLTKQLEEGSSVGIS